MALVATPGASNADSYATLAEANGYNLGIPRTEVWDDADDTEKENALRMAASLLDAMPQAWMGSASTDTQSMGWPRKGMLSRNEFPIPEDVIPVALKDAQSEFARRILEADVTEDDDAMKHGIKRIEAGSVVVEYQRTNQDLFKSMIVPGESAATPVSGLLMIPDIVLIKLVPSWLKQTIGQQQVGSNKFLFFKTL